MQRFDFLVALLLLNLATTSTASASARYCETIFATSNLSSELTAVLPVEFQNAFSALDPILRAKTFEKNFDRRELVSAEREASRIVKRLLVESESSVLKFRELAPKNLRSEATKELFAARLRQEDARVAIEMRLLEIGYGKGSALTQKWSAFRQRHSTALALSLNFAKNAASTALFGVPLFFRSTPWRNFSVPSERRGQWAEIKKEFEQRVDQRDPKLIRDLKIEAAIELTRRIMAAAVLALLTDDFLSQWPKWQSIKAKTLGLVSFGNRGMPSHYELATTAFENWKDVVEAFTGSRPEDGSAEAMEVLEKIRATSREDLWIHIHHNGPLSEPVPQEPVVPPSLTGATIDQMFLGPNN